MGAQTPQQQSVRLALAAIFLLSGCVSMTDKPLEAFTSVAAGQAHAEATEPLNLLVWNIGYAGLGEESDFKTDGGKMLRPPSRAVVEKNVAGITAVLRNQDADIVLMQELASDGFITRGVDVQADIREALQQYDMFWSPDIRTSMLVRALSVEHGPATFTSVMTKPPSTHRIPAEPSVMGVIKRQHHVQVIELDVSGRPWTLINVHLSAFDEGAEKRTEQLDAVLELAREHYAQGRAVVLGGDWNLQLLDTNFPHTSTEDALFWLFPFPHDRLPTDWQIIADPKTPTVRTNERPYNVGENYTTIIDGLIISPNVEALYVETLSLDFKFTDHQPVRASFRRTD